MDRDWSLGRLPEDIASLVAARTALLPDEAVKKIVASELAAKASRWDTHPSTADRIAALRRAEWRGVLRVEGPAARLFQDLPGLCRRNTWHPYEKVLGLAPDRAHLVTSAEMVGNALAAHECDQTAQQVPELPAADCSEWLHLPCDALGELGPRPDPAEFREAVQTSMMHYAACVICEAGVQLQPENFRLYSVKPVRIREAEAASQNALCQAAGALNASARPAALH